MSNGFSPRIFSDRYYRALGKFIAEFAEIEGLMLSALWYFTKVSTPVGKAVFSGVRAEDASGKIKRIADAEDWPQSRKDEWKIISDHLTILRALRNDLVHYGVYWDSVDTWYSTNKRIAHLPERVTIRQITPTILRNATNDLRKLSVLIFVFLYGDQMAVSARKKLRPVLKRAWLYTPPAQETSQLSGRRANQKR
jgi:hypothetical protein